MHRPVGGDEVLEAGEVRARVLLVVDLDPDAEPFCDGGGVHPQPPGVGGQGRVPVVDVGDPADREHDPDAPAREVLDDIRGHSQRHAVQGPEVGRQVQQAERVHEAEDDEVHRRI